MKKLGREVVLVRFPGEGHEISDADHEREMLSRVLKWLDLHLAHSRKVSAGF